MHPARPLDGVYDQEEIKEEDFVTKTVQPLPANAEETCLIERLESAVRSFILRSACKVDCFYTIRKAEVKPKAQNLDESLSSDEESDEPDYVEDHYVALPSIVFSNSPNPDHKHHINCLTSPPLDKEELSWIAGKEVLLTKIET